MSEEEPISGKIEPPYTSRKAAVSEAVDLIAGATKHGEMITRAELERLFGLVFPAVGRRKDYRTLEAIFAGMKERFDAELLSRHQMALRSCGKGRWQVVPSENQARFAAEVARRAWTDGLTKATAIVTHVCVDRLTAAQQRELDDARARLAGVQMLASRPLFQLPPRVA